MITTINEVTFNNLCVDGSTFCQDIMFHNECIGALAQVQSGILKPIKERYQMLVDESEVLKNIFDGWYESEDSGKVFGYFYTLEKFLEYYNLTKN